MRRSPLWDREPERSNVIQSVRLQHAVRQIVRMDEYETAQSSSSTTPTRPPDCFFYRSDPPAVGGRLRRRLGVRAPTGRSTFAAPRITHVTPPRTAQRWQGRAHSVRQLRSIAEWCGDRLQPSGPLVHLTTVHPQADSEARRGTSGLEDLYRSQWAPMVRLAWLMGGNREEAEDIVHDAFLQLEPRWSSIENPPAYLRQTVVNGVRARHRRKDLERRHASYEGDVSSALDDYEGIWASVEALPDRQRQALVLRFYLDLTIAEVADLLDCPIGTAKSLIHRGLAAIREKVQQ